MSSKGMDLVLADMRMMLGSKENDLQTCDLIELTIIFHFCCYDAKCLNPLTQYHFKQLKISTTRYTEGKEILNAKTCLSHLSIALLYLKPKQSLYINFPLITVKLL